MRAALVTALLALASLALACETRSPEPSAQQPQESPPRVQPEPRADEPATSPSPSPSPDELPAVAGVHYLEFVTADGDPTTELPMIVLIHGLGDSPQGLAPLLAHFDTPARVIAPRGLEPHGPGWSWFPYSSRDPDVEALSASIERAADTLAPAIEALAEQRPTRGKPIVTGFSQGGMLSFTLAVEHGELFSAALPIGGWLPPPQWPTSSSVDPEASPPGRPGPPGPPIMAFHGDADERVPLAPTRAAADALAKAGYEVELEVYPGVRHEIPPQLRRDLERELREAIAALPPTQPSE